ncbi:MAG: TlpA family protein disulfide reductase [Anaerolineae bacterium]|nr:TlpA family protein disulfide reductase [Anaerolineae bacterium]
MQIKQPLHWMIFSAILLLAGAGWINASALQPGGSTQGLIPAPQRGFLAPDFTLETTEGSTIRLSELRGKVVLVNLWASWCGPCRAEMPAMQRVYEQYKDHGLVILAVNATNQDSVGAAVGFAQEMGLNFPILLDMDGSVSNAYNLRALPSSFFIDRNGVIQEVVIGGPMAEALLLTRIQRLLEAE